MRRARPFLIFAGLALLLLPDRPGPSAAYHSGQVFARVVGVVLILIAVIPFGPPRGTNKDQLNEP